MLMREGRRGSVEKQQDLKQKQLQQQLAAITTAIGAKQAAYVYDDRASQNGVVLVSDRSGGRPPSPATAPDAPNAVYASSPGRAVSGGGYDTASMHSGIPTEEVVGVMKHITWSDEHGYSLFEVSFVVTALSAARPRVVYPSARP